jgi:hypothetical protein
MLDLTTRLGRQAVARRRLVAANMSIILTMMFLLPGVAAACEGGGEEGGGSITVNKTSFFIKFKGIEAGETLLYQNNTNGVWKPETDSLKILKGPAETWSVSDKCKGKSIAAKGGTCEVEFKMKPPKENEKDEAKFELEAAPTVTAAVEKIP